MSNIERAERLSTSTVRRAESSTRSISHGPRQQDGERTPRPTAQRDESNSSSHLDEHSSRLELPRSVRDRSEHETTRLLSRDFADQDPSPRLRHVRSNATGFRYRHLDGTQPSPSPGPSYSWRHFIDSDRRSVAIAASGRDYDTASHRFSLAGPGPFETLVANQPYVDPGYAQLNPAYDQPANTRPVWGLAKPLPHVLRPGMVPTKDELRKEVSQQKEDQTPDSNDNADLESGKIEPSLRPGKIVSQLDEVRRDREVRLFESYHQLVGSPGLSPYTRPQRGSPAPNRIPDLQSVMDEPIIEEDEEYQHRQSDPDLAGLEEAVSEVNRAKRMNELSMPYQDAIPLSAYEAEADEIHNLHTYWSVVRLRFREPLAELLGITVQYTLGFSANLAITVSRGTAGAGKTSDWAWGLATMIAIYIAGGISGAHLNPAISIMLYIYRGFPLIKVPGYVTAQVLGAFLATLITFTIFRPGLIALQISDLAVQAPSSPHLHANMMTSIMPQASDVLANFLTFPRQIWIGNGTAFFTELVASTILAVSVLALGDDTNAPPGAGMNAFIVGLLIAVLGMAFGSNTGLAMNPARDFGPRIALAVLGYPSLFEDGYWIRVNWAAPICGTVLGGFVYDSMIFSGGESPVNYPPERIRRAVRKWRARWWARLGRAELKLRTVKEGVVG